MYNEYGDEEFKQITDNSIHSAISMPQQKQKMNLTESNHSLNSFTNNNNESLKETPSEPKKSKTSLHSSAKKVDNKSTNTNNNISQSDISKSSVHTNEKNRTDKNKSTTSSIVEEVPLSNEDLQYAIIKELHRIYGDKLVRILLNYNAQNSQGVIDLIIRNIKLARQKTMKIQNRIAEPDDLVTKEFLHRYNKELQYIIKHYKQDKMQRSSKQQRAMKTITQNVRVMKKIQDIQTKKIKDEIEMKKKAREVRNHHNQLRLCNEVYSKAFQFEKEKYIEETAYQMEIRRIENEEKRKAMMEIEKYYKDKIAILQELLRREKRDREI